MHVIAPKLRWDENRAMNRKVPIKGKIAGIAYEINGSPTLRRPLLYFHGIPGSRRESRLLTRVGQDLDVSIIALERPGYGESEPNPERRILDWPAM